MAEAFVLVAMGGREWNVTRARLGGFLRLQEAQETVRSGVEQSDNGTIVGGLFAFLCVCLPDLTAETFEAAPWHEVMIAYMALAGLNILPGATSFSILRYANGKSRHDVPWDHPLRGRLLWTHMIATAYGWSLDQIENLWPEEAVALVQEIQADEQAEREFIHSLSEVAYHYDKRTKKSRYQPLKRPAWMTVRPPKRLKTRLRKSLLPVGVVLYPEGAEGEIPQ